MTFPLVCSNNLTASSGIWKSFNLWDLLSVECWFVTSCGYHTMKSYIFNKWHGRLERSLDGISLSYNAPKKEWQLIMVCCHNIIIIFFFFCGFMLCIKYAFVLFLTFVSLYVVLPWRIWLFMPFPSSSWSVCLLLDVCDFFHLFLSQPYEMRDMFVF